LAQPNRREEESDEIEVIADIIEDITLRLAEVVLHYIERECAIHCIE